MELTGCFHVFMQLLFVYFVTIQCELHAPCFDCEIYRLHHRANGVKKTPVKKDTGRMQGDAPYKGKVRYNEWFKVMVMQWSDLVKQLRSENSLRKCGNVIRNI